MLSINIIKTCKYILSEDVDLTVYKIFELSGLPVGVYETLLFVSRFHAYKIFAHFLFLRR